MNNGYYKSIPGSRDLITGSSNARPEDMNRSELGLMEVGPDAVSLPSRLLDELMPSLDPVEQSTLLHLVRIALKDGNNYCRVGKPELMRRVNISERKLHKALGALVEKGLVDLLHRDNGGTLYKLNIIDSTVNVGSVYSKDTVKALQKAVKKVTMRERPMLAAASEEAIAKPGKDKPLTIRDMADEFYNTRKRKPTDREMDAAMGEITVLLEDGFTREEVMKGIIWFAANEPDEKDLSRLPYFINTALNEV